MSRRRVKDYLNYKKNCDKAYIPLEDEKYDTLPDLLKYAEQIYNSYISAVRCYEQRIKYRDNYIPIEEQDLEHEKQIQIALNRANELYEKLRQLYSEIYSIEQQQTSSIATSSKKSSKKSKKKSKSKSKSKSPIIYDTPSISNEELDMLLSKITIEDDNKLMDEMDYLLNKFNINITDDKYALIYTTLLYSKNNNEWSLIELFPTKPEFLNLIIGILTTKTVKYITLTKNLYVLDTEEGGVNYITQYKQNFLMTNNPKDIVAFLEKSIQSFLNAMRLTTPLELYKIYTMDKGKKKLIPNPSEIIMMNYDNLIIDIYIPNIMDTGDIITISKLKNANKQYYDDSADSKKKYLNDEPLYAIFNNDIIELIYSYMKNDDLQLMLPLAESYDVSWYNVFFKKIIEMGNYELLFNIVLFCYWNKYKNLFLFFSSLFNGYHVPFKVGNQSDGLIEEGISINPAIWDISIKKNKLVVRITDFILYCQNDELSSDGLVLFTTTKENRRHQRVFIFITKYINYDEISAEPFFE